MLKRTLIRNVVKLLDSNTIITIRGEARIVDDILSKYTVQDCSVEDAILIIRGFKNRFYLSDKPYYEAKYRNCGKGIWDIYVKNTTRNFSQCVLLKIYIDKFDSWNVRNILDYGVIGATEV